MFSFLALSSVITKSGGDNKLFPLILLPIMFLLMSIDESVQIHEWLGEKSDIFLSSGNRIGTIFHETGIWMFIIGIPFLALFSLTAYSLKLNFSDKPSALKKLVIGMIIMLTGALRFETLNNFIGTGFASIVIVFEEGLEMIGVTVMLWAIYDMTVCQLWIIKIPNKCLHTD